MPVRIPLPSDDELTPEHREMLNKVPPLNVFRMVAGTQRGLRPFLQLGAAALSSSMDARRREIAVLRVAHATSAGYERAQHERLARVAGVSEEEIAAIAAEEPVASLGEEANLICRVADEVSRDVRLSDEALAELIERYGAREASDVILLVSFYNMVSRFLESTRVELEEDAPERWQELGDSAQPGRQDGGG
jgi:4-carboxymuconolactone decarboxylase